jgi:hypothetical protein
MSSQTKNKDAAYAFLVWMLGRANGNIYVDNGGAIVRDSLFYGKMTSQQVDGQEFILDTWEDTRPTNDVRWLAYSLVYGLVLGLLRVPIGFAAWGRRFELAA